MIAGPILPRTTESLRRLAFEQSEHLETGLRVLRREVELDCSGTLDALVLDASGRIGLLFLSDFERVSLASEIERVAQWWSRNASLLVSSVPELIDRIDEEPRILVYAFEFTASGLEQLQQLQLPRLELLRVEAARIEQQLCVGVVPVESRSDASVGPAATPAGTRAGTQAGARAGTQAGTRVGSVRDPFALTEDFVAGHEEVVLAFTDRLRRLDPSLRATGDRFLRRFVVGGRELVSLRRARQGVVVEVPFDSDDAVESGEVREFPLEDAAAGRQAFDAVLRRFCALSLPASARGAGPWIETRPSSEPEPNADFGAEEAPVPFQASTAVLEPEPEPHVDTSVEPPLGRIEPITETLAQGEPRRLPEQAPQDELAPAPEPVRPPSSFRVEEAELTDDELGAFLADD